MGSGVSTSKSPSSAFGKSKKKNNIIISTDFGNMVKAVSHNTPALPSDINHEYLVSTQNVPVNIETSLDFKKDNKINKSLPEVYNSTIFTTSINKATLNQQVMERKLSSDINKLTSERKMILKRLEIVKSR